VSRRLLIHALENDAAISGGGADDERAPLEPLRFKNCCAEVEAAFS
jgi:hypothetical protein